MNVLRKIILLFLLFGFCNANLEAQHYQFDRYTIEDGLANSNAYCLLQDHRGYIWVGTIGGGVSIFNGSDFENFTSQNGLASNDVRSLMQDTKGRVWIGTSEGISIYDGRTFQNIQEENGLSGAILCFYEMEDGQVWAGGDDGLFLISETSEGPSVRRFTQEDGLSNNFIFDIERDVSGKYWLATYYGGINVMEYQVDSIRCKWMRGGIDIPSDLIISLEVTSDSTIWAGSYDAGAFQITISPEGYSVTKVLGLISPLEDRTIWDIQKDQRGDLWFATNSKGLKRMQHDGFKSFKERNGLPNNQLLSLLEDREGSIWIGTNGSGITRFSGDHFTHENTESGLQADQIYGITEASDGRIFLASYGSGLAMQKQAGASEFVYLNEEMGLAGDLVSDVALDSAGNIWLATDKGACKYDGSTFNIYGERQGLLGDYVNVILVDRDGVVWCGSKYGLSAIWQDQILNLTTEQGLIDNTIIDLLEDKKGNIWIATLGGLVRYDKSVLQTYDELEGLNFKKINDITEGPDGDIWIATNGGGIYRFDVQSNDSVMIHRVESKVGLSTSAYTAIQFLDESTLIAGYSRGFDKLHIPEGEQALIHRREHYNKSDGFIALETNLGAIFKDSKGRIWFGTPDGATVYDASIEPKFDKRPLIDIIGLELFYEKLDWSTFTSEIEPWTALPVDLTLEHFQKQLTFKFNGVSMHNSEKLWYTHYLEGIDNDWSPLKTERQVTYSGLPPGEYSFQVVAQNKFGDRSDAATFSFTILPPWYQTTWFYLLSLAGIILLVMLFVRWREMRLKSENEYLEKVVEERTTEVVKQKEEIEHKNKDITDSINYARKIQEAILPRKDLMESYFDDYFVVFMPKDIVSGDFYWFNEHKGKMIFSAADCTGHGVPGAFMSMIGTSLLNDAVNEKGLMKPYEILNEVRTGVIHAMQQTGAEGEQKDGMDMCLCSYDKATKVLEYAGANNSLYIVRKGEEPLKRTSGEEVPPSLEENGVKLFEIKPNKMPVAYYAEKSASFDHHEFSLIEGDCVYSFSDGYPDQFGGPKGKKFMYGKLKKKFVELHKQNMKGQREDLLSTINNWMGDQYEQIDDICIVGIRV